MAYIRETITRRPMNLLDQALSTTMAAIKFGHGLEMLAAAQKLVAAFGKEPTK
jgi:hypothetical protein